jgi:hypothetical protein
MAQEQGLGNADRTERFEVLDDQVGSHEPDSSHDEGGVGGAGEGVGGVGFGAEAPEDAAALAPDAEYSPHALDEIRIEVARLVRRHAELARDELRDELRTEAASLRSRGLGVGGIGAIIAVTLLLVSAILALGTMVPAWGAALAMCAVVMLASAIGALVDWNLRTRRAVDDESRDPLQDDLRWTKRRLS